MKQLYARPSSFRRPWQVGVCLVRTLVIIASILCAQRSFGQLGSIKLPVSPNAAALGKFGEIPVSHYTGIPSIVVPLHTIETKQLKLDISLSYHAGGIRVEEEASWVGLGWALNAGGVITRSVRGLDDVEQNNNKVSYPFATALMPSDANNDLSLPNQTASAYMQNVCGNPNDQVDTQPDVFYYNFGGKSGKFVLAKHSPSDTQFRVRLLTQEKIRFEADIITNAQQWTATVEDGTKYIFAARENGEATGPAPGYGPLTPACTGSGCSPTTSWYLTEIISTKGERISFFYEYVSALRNKPMESEKRYTLAGAVAEISGTTVECSPPPSNYQPLGGIPNNGSPVKSYSITNALILDSIAFPGGSVKFKTDERLDMSSRMTVTPRISAIIIRRKEGKAYFETKRLLLGNDDYFNASHRQDQDLTERTNQLRLKLNSVTEVSAGIAKEPFRFEYNNSPLPNNLLPAKDSKS
jgi:hypothetical protein